MAFQVPQQDDLFPLLSKSTTIYQCTSSHNCTFETPTYEFWVTHELVDHESNHDIWYCHNNQSLKDVNCQLAFEDKASFDKHFRAYHAKDKAGIRRELVHSEFHLGPAGPESDDRGRLFWCGFCKRVLACAMTGIWRVDRFEHVAGHFTGNHGWLEKFEVGEWEWLKMAEPDPVVEELEAKKGLKRGSGWLGQKTIAAKSV